MVASRYEIKLRSLVIYRVEHSKINFIQAIHLSCPTRISSNSKSNSNSNSNSNPNSMIRDSPFKRTQTFLPAKLMLIYNLSITVPLLSLVFISSQRLQGSQRSLRSTIAAIFAILAIIETSGFHMMTMIAAIARKRRVALDPIKVRNIMGYKAFVCIAIWDILYRKDRKSGFHIKPSRSQGSQRYKFFYLCDRDRKDRKGCNDRKVLWFPYGRKDRTTHFFLR